MDLRSPRGAPTSGMVTLTHVLYGMHGFSALMGLLGPMFIVTAFLTGWPSIIAVIIIRGWITLANGGPMPDGQELQQL